MRDVGLRQLFSKRARFAYNAPGLLPFKRRPTGAVKELGMRKGRAWAASVTILLLSFAGPVVVVSLFAPEPRTRRIHVEHFRYGMQPEVIHVARGDNLIFTFSSRDTPHSFFLQEYDTDAKVSPQTGKVEVTRPSNPEADPVLMDAVEFTVARPGISGIFSTKSRYRCHVYCGKMHAFEQGILVVHPNTLHAGATGVLFAIPLIGLLRLRQRRGQWPPEHAPQELMVDLFERWPMLRRVLATPGLQFWLMTLMSVLMYIILLTSLLGTKMAGGNLGVLLLWVVWLVALVVVFVPFGGRAWCTVCPIPMFGDALQRGSATDVRTGAGTDTGSRFRGLNRKWPRMLSGALPRTIVFLCFGTVSVLIISQPRWTGWALLVLLAMATALPIVFELRAFCRYLCPINSFIGLYATAGRLALRSIRNPVCDKCGALEKETCLKGNEMGWACPYGLTVSEINRNMDCGLCLECLRSCAFRNVSLFWRPFGLERPLGGRDEAMQSIVMMTLGIVYCITFQGPWHSLRDMVDIVDKKNWDLFAVYSASLWLITLGLMPLVVSVLARIGRALSRASISAREAFVRDASTLVPFGLFVWIAFGVALIMVEGTFILSAVSDPFGWGWNLFGTAGYPWWQVAPEAIPAIQAGLVLIGFALALGSAWRHWSTDAPDQRRALVGALPICAFQFAVTYGLIWFFTS